MRPTTPLIDRPSHPHGGSQNAVLGLANSLLGARVEVTFNDGRDRESHEPVTVRGTLLATAQRVAGTWPEQFELIVAADEPYHVGGRTHRPGAAVLALPVGRIIDMTPRRAETPSATDGAAR